VSLIPTCTIQFEKSSSIVVVSLICNPEIVSKISSRYDIDGFCQMFGILSSEPRTTFAKINNRIGVTG
jgi:hypothetical protein